MVDVGSKNCAGDFVLRSDAAWSILLVLKRNVVSVTSCCITNQPQIEWLKAIVMYYFL